MRNLSFPTLRAFGSAAAKFADQSRFSEAPAGLEHFTQWIRCLQFLTLLALTAGVSLAQSIPPDIAKRLDDLDKATKNAQMAGDNAWMLTSAALVLMMTGPGLALFYGGLVRKKNVLGTMMHSFILMATVSDSVGGGRLQPGVRRRQRRSSAICAICSCTAWARLPMPTTPPPFRSRPT